MTEDLTPELMVRLLEAVIGLDRDTYHRLYANNAKFHNAVASMVRVLPPLMRLMADDAVRSEQERQQAEALLRYPPPSWPVENQT